MDKRDKMANQLLMRGHATIDELLEASFGEWPPRGLDIVHRNDRRVNLYQALSEFDPHLTTKDMPYGVDPATLRGMAKTIGPRDIYVQQMRRPNTTLGHETVHILQGDHSIYRGGDVVGLNSMSDVFDAQGHDFASNKVMESQMAAHFIPQRMVKGDLSRIFEFFGARPDEKREKKLAERVEYLSSGIEMQARLHEILIHSYPQWGRLPANAAELQMAMLSGGLNPPETLTALEGAPNRRELGRTFKMPFAHCSAAQEINFILKGFDRAGMNAFWNDTLPRLYADLIEMYGDRHGRARFGLGENATHALREQYRQDVWLARDTRWRQAPEANIIGAIVYADMPTHLRGDVLSRALCNIDVINYYDRDTGRLWVHPNSEKKLKSLITDETAAPVVRSALAAAGPSPS